MRKLKNSELDRLSIEEFKHTEKIPLTVVMDNVRSLNNIGSIFRTADAFLIEQILLCGITAQPPHRDIHKTALGATDSVSWSYHESTTHALRELKSEGYVILAIEQTDQGSLLSEYEVDPVNKYALVFGHEIKGVTQEVIDACDGSIEIPQYGTKHSLNIAVSAGIVLWHFSGQLRRDGLN